MRVLAVDPGKKRVGVAVSDPTGTVARALVTLDGRDRYRLIGELTRLVDEHHADEVVLGLPLNLDGSPGPAARSAVWLRDRLARRVKVPVKLVDERLSTVIAQQVLDRGMQGEIDSAAAAVILQDYLDRHRKTEERGGPESNRDSQ